MGVFYDHLNTAERSQLMLGLHNKMSLRQIALRIGRSVSTLSREVRRHRNLAPCEALPYECSRASMRAYMARMKPRRKPKLSVDSGLFGVVQQQLRQGWSPQHIAGLMRKNHPAQSGRYHQTVSHETIYTALCMRCRAGSCAAT
jgi:transposase, IS30 family